MNEKRLPIRKCSACLEHFPKNSLIRIVKTKNGDIILDDTGKINGRGAYLCKSPACLNKALKRGSLERSLGCKIPGEVRALIEGALSNAEE